MGCLGGNPGAIMLFAAHIYSSSVTVLITDSYIGSQPFDLTQFSDGSLGYHLPSSLEMEIMYL